jgi:hypothetical protein
MADGIDHIADDIFEPASKEPDPANGLLGAIVFRLMPLFVIPGVDAGYAPLAAAEAIESFDPQSRSEIANIGRILALTLASVDTIAQGVTLDLPADERLRFLTKGQGLSASADRTERVMMLRRKQALAARADDDRQPERSGPARQQPQPPDESGSAVMPEAEHPAPVTVAPAPMAPVPTPVAQPAAPSGAAVVPPALAAPRADASWFGTGNSVGIADPAGFEAVVQRALAGGAQDPDLDVLLAGLRSLAGVSGLLAETPDGEGASPRDSLFGRDARPPPRDYADGP